MTIKEMLEKRATLINQARQIYNTAETEQREPTAEERQNFDKLMDEADNLKTEAGRMHRLEVAERQLSDSQGRVGDLETAAKGTKKESRTEPQTIELRSSACGDARIVTLAGEQATQQYLDEFRAFLRTGEVRALQADSDVAGGFLAPEKFIAELIQELDDMLFMRQIARVLPPLRNADSLGIPSLDHDPADADWTVELATGDEDTTMDFGKRELKPHPMGKLLKVSNKLVRVAAIPVDTLVRNRLAYKFAVPEENAFLNGSGAGQPLGVFTASDLGVSTGRDVSTGNTDTEIRFDGLIEALYSIKAQYRRKLNWIFHRDGVKQIRKLKDGEGRYIWEASVQAGQPDTILRWPARESEYAPNTFTTGLYVGIVGNFDYYWIAEALTMTIQVLKEYYAITNQIGYIGRMELDAMPVLESAFARVKLA